MTVVTVAGHGGWDRDELASRGESNWINSAPIPVYFFTENMKSMWGLGTANAGRGADMLATLDEDDLMELVNQSQYSRKIDAGSGGLNYVVGDDETSDDLVAGDGVILHHGGEYSLQNLFDAYPSASAIFWCCCSAAMLNPVGGEQLGVDEGQHILQPADKEHQVDWQGYSGDFTPQGVQQCDATCAECNGRCRLGTEHQAQYAHQCDQGHTFTDDQASLGLGGLYGDAPAAAPAPAGYLDDPDWKNFIERLVASDDATSREMWGELGFDAQAALRADPRVSAWAQGAGV